MAEIAVKNLIFTYPGREAPALSGVDFTIESGQFVTLCGPSGCGKTTLLRCLKPALAPHGKRSGSVTLCGADIYEMSHRGQSEKIGFVMQSPDNQLVTDKVWHELAFGLESLGAQSAEIRRRVAEMASFFGIQEWFHRDVCELSGGQKQLLNLASVMVMQPSVLILDEPTGQLDPIAAADFLATVWKINRELGVSVIMTEHRLEAVLPMSDRVLCMDSGRIICDGAPYDVGRDLRERGHTMALALPAPMRIWQAVASDGPCPVTVREGREWLDTFSEISEPESWREDEGGTSGEIAVQLSEVWFRYGRESSDVAKGLSLEARTGELLCVLGGNGTGKTTALGIIAGANRPYRGSVRLFGEHVGKIAASRLFGGDSGSLLGVLPQNPQTLFVKKTVLEDLVEVFSSSKLPMDEKERRAREIAGFCRITHVLGAHPYDLSGGEMQRAALAKVLLLRPKVLLLDEPTKGLDAEFKLELAALLRELAQRGAAVIMVSHDVEFCAEHASRCVMFFDGNIVSEGGRREFFAGNSFYTTAANRMARHVLPHAVTARDVVEALGGSMPQGRPRPHTDAAAVQEERPTPQSEPPPARQALSRRTLAAVLVIIAAIPLTIFLGIYLLDDRRYYIISLAVILQAMLPFALVFERRRPQARELVIIAVLCAIGVAGRAALFMLPQVKPMLAVVIVAGVAFGGETGFLVGAVTGFVSNMFFGQGPWTPWQMLALGLIGFLAGVLFGRGRLRAARAPLCVFGALSAFVVYGGIVDISAVFTFQQNINLPMLLAAFAAGVPFNLVNSAATAVFLWFICQPMLDKLDRIKQKYGIMTAGDHNTVID